MSRPSIGVWCVNQRNILVYFQIDILKSQRLQRIVVSKSNLIGESSFKNIYFASGSQIILREISPKTIFKILPRFHVCHTKLGPIWSTSGCTRRSHHISNSGTNEGYPIFSVGLLIPVPLLNIAQGFPSLLPGSSFLTNPISGILFSRGLISRFPTISIPDHNKSFEKLSN